MLKYLRTAGVAFALALTPAAAAHADVYVASGGSDGASGDQTHPLATLTAALARTKGGERVVVGPGDFAAATDQRDRTEWTNVVGAGGGLTRVAGLTLSGSRWLDVSDITFTGGVLVTDLPQRGGNRGSAHVRFHDAEFTGAGSCLRARNATRDLEVRESVFHHCGNGIGAPAGGGIPQSTGFTIADNHFLHLTLDAIQIGQWNDVDITGNVIDDVRDPAAVYHNDGVQLTGNSRDVLISHNRISNSRTQLVFIQDAVGPIDDVRVTDNLLLGAGAVAMQIRGATRAQVIHNTIWGGKDGGLWLAADPSTTTTPHTVLTDAVVVNNVLQDFQIYNRTRAAVAGGNVVRCKTTTQVRVEPAKGSTCLPDLGFVSVAAGDLHLQAASAARALGSTLMTSPIDLDGLARSGSVPGAFR